MRSRIDDRLAMACGLHCLPRDQSLGAGHEWGILPAPVDQEQLGERICAL